MDKNLYGSEWREANNLSILFESCHESHMIFVNLKDNFEVKKVTVCCNLSKIPSSFLLHHTTPTPTWLPTRHRKGTERDGSHSKSSYIDNCSERVVRKFCEQANI